jgi:hypothetical protein
VQTKYGTLPSENLSIERVKDVYSLDLRLSWQ